MLFFCFVLLSTNAESSRSSRSKYIKNENNAFETFCIYTMWNLRLDNGKTTSNDRTNNWKKDDVNHRNKRIKFQFGESRVLKMQKEMTKKRNIEHIFSNKSRCFQAEITFLGNKSDRWEKSNSRRFISNCCRTIEFIIGRIFSLFSIDFESTVCS